MNYQIRLYQTSLANPIEKFIYQLQKPTIAKILRTIDLLETYGLTLGMPHSKRIEPNIYELRIRGQEEIRILYTSKNGIFYLLNAFKKKSRQTPVKELELARQRLTKI